MSLRRIFALLLFVFGTASLIFGVWLYTNSLNNSFAALMFGVGGVVMIAIAVLVYRSTSFLEVIRAIASWMLILGGIPAIAFTLFVIVAGGDRLNMIMLVGLPGLTAGTLGWTLLQPKYPIVIAKKIISGMCITSGAGAVLFPIGILSIFGFTIGFASIAPIYVISGIGLVAIGIRLRRPPKTEEN